MKKAYVLEFDSGFANVPNGFVFSASSPDWARFPNTTFTIHEIEIPDDFIIGETVAGEDAVFYKNSFVEFTNRTKDGITGVSSHGFHHFNIVNK
jgi:hypothetical protein